jgi:HK97 family phage prohead protease
MMRELWMPQVRDRLGLSDEELCAAGLAARRVTRHGAALIDTRTHHVEVRANEDGTRSITGYATTWETPYEVAGGPPWGWVETIARGAATKSLAERDDVRFLINHEGLPQARSRGLVIDTMRLEADDIGLRVDIPSLDERNPRVLELLSALDRGDVDQMSFAFLAMRQEWNEDYTERRILELQLFDVSAVTYPANPATIIAARAATDEVPVPQRAGLPLGLALAQAAALD